MTENHLIMIAFTIILSWWIIVHLRNRLLEHEKKEPIALITVLYIATFILIQITIWNDADFNHILNRSTITGSINQILCTSIAIPFTAIWFTDKIINKVSEIVLTCNMLTIPILFMYYNKDVIAHYNEYSIIFLYLMLMIPWILVFYTLSWKNNYSNTKKAILFICNLILEVIILFSLWTVLRSKIMYWGYGYIDLLFALAYSWYIVNTMTKVGWLFLLLPSKNKSLSEIEKHFYSLWELFDTREHHENQHILIWFFFILVTTVYFNKYINASQWVSVMIIFWYGIYAYEKSREAKKEVEITEKILHDKNSTLE